eukprot:1457401-Pleurochrysis_carterae.AAC.3
MSASPTRPTAVASTPVLGDTICNAVIDGTNSPPAAPTPAAMNAWPFVSLVTNVVFLTATIAAGVMHALSPQNGGPRTSRHFPFAVRPDARTDACFCFVCGGSYVLHTVHAARCFTTLGTLTSGGAGHAFCPQQATRLPNSRHTSLVCPRRRPDPYA